MTGSGRWEKCSCAEKVLDLYSLLNTVEKMAKASITPEIDKILMLHHVQKAEKACEVDLSDVKEKVEEGYEALEEDNYRKASSSFFWAKTELKSKISECAWEKF